jgi:hypothetical protein
LRVQLRPQPLVLRLQRCSAFGEDGAGISGEPGRKAVVGVYQRNPLGAQVVLGVCHGAHQSLEDDEELLSLLPHEPESLPDE